MSLFNKIFDCLLLLDVYRVHVQALVPELVQPREGDPEIGRLQQVLDLLTVGVEPGRVDVDAGGQHSVDNLQPRSRLYK